MDAEATTLVTTVIWTLRICLPIILFLLYYRVPFPDILPKKNRHTRATLLKLRPEPGKAPPPMANLGLVGQEAAPHLFVKREKRGAKGESRGDAPKLPEPPVPEALPQEDMLHLESLLNYMAFNRKSHRIFHPLHPPPPPSAPPPPQNASPSADFQDKANLDAQMVLQGALMFKKLEVVADVYDSLTNTKVQPSEQTFTLMIEVCISAHNLPKASDFLMKMEQCHFSPDVKLLDRVMELYAQHKVTTELGQRLNAEQDTNGSTGLSTGLSADAPEFVPTSAPQGDEAWDSSGRRWQSWDSQWDQEWNGTRAKQGKAKSKGDGKGKGGNSGKWEGGAWAQPTWNKWQSEDWSKTQASKGKGKKDTAKGKDKGEKKGKGKDSSSEMPEKQQKKPGAVWRKKEGAEDAQDA